MSIEILQEDSYKNLTSKQVKELITYLKDNNYEFNLTANINAISFNPPLPQNISNSFGQFTLFTLANFTFSSLVINDDYVEFEAGFGAENFGSVCTVPYFSVFQLGIDDSILFINPVATVEKYFKKETSQETRSKNAFKSFKKED